MSTPNVETGWRLDVFAATLNRHHFRADTQTAMAKAERLVRDHDDTPGRFGDLWRQDPENETLAEYYATIETGES